MPGPSSVEAPPSHGSEVARTVQRPAADTAHADLSCAVCHDGPRPPGRVLGVATTDGCLGCHEDGGGTEVTLAHSGTVHLPRHANHPGLDGRTPMECAQCHTHPVGNAPLQTDVEGCGLCHEAALDADPPGECRSCHVAPSQRPRTSQGLEIPHAEIPWIEGGCVRCHGSVVTPTEDREIRECTSCHLETAPRLALRPNGAAVEAVDSTALAHTAHPRVTCAGCHLDPAHRIDEMSSAVALDCASCHAQSHDLTTAAFRNATCVDCHRDTHIEQQGLVLGLVPWDGDRVRPSIKFAAGIGCRGCHADARELPEPPLGPDGGAHPGLKGTAERCTLCHLEPYADVLDDWRAGGLERVSRAASWVDAHADRAAPEALEAARARIDFVRAAGMVHGPQLGDALLREAVEEVQAGYSAAGLPTPLAPDLGAPPRAGLCTYCHLDPSRAWSLDAMPADFHRDALLSRDRR